MSRSDEALRSFARDVGQELTPSLAILCNRIEVMLAELRSDQPPVDIVGDLETLYRHAVQMATIVKGLFCISGDNVSEIHPIDINALVEDFLSAVTPRLAQRRVEVRASLDRTIPPGLADRDALKFVLTSLVETAAQTRSIVEVMTGRAEDGGVRIDVESGPQAQGTVRPITLRDPLPLALAAARVWGLGGTVEQRIENAACTFAISLRAVWAR